MEKTFTLRFREPVTLAMVRSACALAAISIDDLFDDSTGALAGLSLSMEAAQAFCDLTLHDAPHLGAMEFLEAEALAAMICSNFFMNVLARRWRRQAEILLSFTSASAGRHGAGVRARA